jgi:hypothetical protein
MKLTSKIATGVFLSIILLAGCNSPPPSTVQVENAKPVPQEQKPDVGFWNIQEPSINPIDGVRTQFLSVEGPPGTKLVLCFDNGKPCSVGAYVKSPCWVDGGEDRHYERQVRLKFDEDKFLVQSWGITDDHHGIFPYSPKTFVSNLQRHKVFLLEFGCARWDSDVVTFDIRGLQAAL